MASSSTEPAAKRARCSLDDPEGDFDLGIEQEEQYAMDQQAEIDIQTLQQDAEAEAVDAAIVGDDGEILHPMRADRRDQVFGNAAQAEAAGHDGHAVEKQAFQRFGGVFANLVCHTHFLTPRGGF